MTTLALLPALLVLCLHLPRWVRRSHPRRWLEAGALTAALVTVAQFAVSPLSVRVGEVPVTVTPLVLVLPFLLWAAVRFGTAGASLSLLVTALSAVRSAIAHAVYTDPAAAEASVLTLQAFLIMLAIPLLCLAALVEERYRARLDMAGRLAFEAVLARVSASFVHVPTPDITRAVEASLERLGRFIGLDGLVLIEFPPGGGGAQAIAIWTAIDRTRPLLMSLGSSCPWTIGQLLAERSVTAMALADLPAEADADRRALDATAVRAALAMPLVVGGRAIGGLVCLAMVADWPGDQSVPRSSATGRRRLRQCPGANADRQRAARERGDEVGHPDCLAQCGGRPRPARRGRRRQPAVAAGRRRSEPRHSGRSDLGFPCGALSRRRAGRCVAGARGHRGRGGSAGRTKSRRHRRVPARGRSRSIAGSA